MMESDNVRLRRELADALSFEPPSGDLPEVTVLDSVSQPGFVRHRIAYRASDGDEIPAFIFVPDHGGPHPGIVVFHQHASQWHYGKSEVAGLAGDRWQAFGPALALAGFVVLAPDSIAFEDRRHNVVGIDPHPDDWLQHYNEMAYRLVRGDTLMRRVLRDAADAVSLLTSWDDVDRDRIGVLGHSYGGNTVLFHAAVDDRVRFGAASGAACSFRTRIGSRTPIEMSQLLPGFAARFDIEDLIRAIAPRPLLLVSGQEDTYSHDAPRLVQLASPAYAAQGTPAGLTSHHYPGGHQLDQERFETIVQWAVQTSRALG